MPVLPRAPSPAALADAWTEAARATLTREAGRDGRLTRGAAVRVGEASDFGRFAQDNLQSFFDRTGQQSVAVHVFLRSERARIEAAAQGVAGANQIVSLVEGAQLPAEVRDDFKALRGRIPVDVPALSGQALVDASTDLARASFASGAAVKLASPPWQVRGRDPIVEDVPHTVAGHAFDVWIAAGRVYASMAADRAGTGLVGWYDVGAVPRP